MQTWIRRYQLGECLKSTERACNGVRRQARKFGCDFQLVRFVLAERWIVRRSGTTLNSKRGKFATRDRDTGLPRDSGSELGNGISKLPIGIARDPHGEIAVNDEPSRPRRYMRRHRHEIRKRCAGDQCAGREQT